jgi:hypothetical protein
LAGVFIEAMFLCILVYLKGICIGMTRATCYCTVDKDLRGDTHLFFTFREYVDSIGYG